jgi:hypothetical protein
MNPRGVGWVTLCGLLTLACAREGAYRTGRDASEYVVADGALCEERRNSPPSQHRVPVAYVEIDEQGYFHDRNQIERVLELVRGGARPKYVVVYIHGWHHNAGGEDDNVRRFKCALSNLQEIDSNLEEEVVGIYIGWRGESLALPLLRYLTFWDRKSTSEEIGRGSLVEFLTVLERTAKPTPRSRNKLMLIGHSFGASVAFNAIGQTLMVRFLLDAEKLASRNPSPTHSQSKPGLLTGYGDLVVLVNPAIEATRLMPFFGSLSEHTAKEPFLFTLGQPPRLVILSSEGDWATRGTFPTARAFSTLFELYRDLSVQTPYGGRMGFDQRQLDRQTMGNVESLYTHEPLRQEPPTKDWKWDGKCPPARRDWQSDAIAQRQDDQRRNGQLATGFGWSQMFEGTGIRLRHRGITTPSNPVWVMAVGTELIPDHGGVPNPVIVCFFDQLLGDVETTIRRGERHQEIRQSGPSPGRAE